MIIGLGTDIVEISRIENLYRKFGQKFLLRIFTINELNASEKFDVFNRKICYFAKRFAAKEAFSKAIGFGFGKYINFNDISILNIEDTGQPFLNISESAKKSIGEKFTKDCIYHISMSDEKKYATATVIIEKF